MLLFNHFFQSLSFYGNLKINTLIILSYFPSAQVDRKHKIHSNYLTRLGSSYSLNKCHSRWASNFTYCLYTQTFFVIQLHLQTVSFDKQNVPLLSTVIFLLGCILLILLVNLRCILWLRKYHLSLKAFCIYLGLRFLILVGIVFQLNRRKEWFDLIKYDRIIEEGYLDSALNIFILWKFRTSLKDYWLCEDFS